MRERPGDVVGAHHRGHPGQAPERLLLRNRDAEHAEVDLVGRNVAAGELPRGDPGREGQAVQMREPRGVRPQRFVDVMAENTQRAEEADLPAVAAGWLSTRPCSR